MQSRLNYLNSNSPKTGESSDKENEDDPEKGGGGLIYKKKLIF